MKMLNTPSADIPTTGKTSKLTQAKRRSLAICALLVAMTAASACDSKADLTFDQTTFTEVKTSGITLGAGKCQGPVSTRMMSRFVLMGSQGAALTEDDVIGLNGGNLKDTALTYSNSSVAGYLPGGVSCESNKTCGGSGGYPKLSCSSSLDNAGAGCGKNEILTAQGEPKFLANLEKDQVFVALVEDGASVRGMVPSPYGKGMAYNGNGDSKSTAGQERGRITDVGVARLALVKGMVGNLKKLARAAKDTQGKDTEFGLYRFSEGTQDEVDYFPAKGTTFVGPSSFNAAVDGFKTESTDPKVFGGSNVVKALEAVFEGTSKSEYPKIKTAVDNGKEVVLFLFVDGPDDYRTDPSGIINKLGKAGVRTFIVHVDPALPSGDDAALFYPDLPSYYANQKICTDDTQCHTYEVCRVPSKLVVGSETYPKSPTDTYCVPNRGTDGRIGPIDEYSELACATGGGYVYLPSTLNDLDAKYSPNWIPWALDALWEVPVDFPNSEDTMTRGRYQLGTKFEVKLDLRRRSVDLEKRENGPDTRAAVVVPVGP